jgi:integrase/recombinase XerD
MLELYFKYNGVIERFRSGVLGNEIDCIAAGLFNAGYKRDSARRYLARIARFSAYAAECGCCREIPIPPQIVDRYLQATPTRASRWAASGALRFAVRCLPERFAAEPSQEDRDRPLLTAYMQHLRVVRGLHPKTCEGLALTARRMLSWQR